MRNPNYLLRRLVALFCVVAFIYLVTGYIWWTGESFCIGSMTSCVKLQWRTVGLRSNGLSLTVCNQAEQREGKR